MIGIDTSSFIDLFKSVKELIELINNLEDTFCTTIINYQELMFGLNPLNSKEVDEENYYNNFLENFMIIGLDKKSCKKSRDISIDLKKKGKIIGEFDVIIAGILLSDGVNTIITRNKKHFENIPGLKVLSY